MEVMGTTPRMGRRSMALADIDPKYVSQSGIWEATEMETSRGSIRIQHLTAVSAAGPRPLSAGMPSSSSNPTSSPRFPKLEECAHFHYDSVELPTLKIFIRDDPSKSMSLSTDEDVDRCAFSIEVVSGGQCWAIRRTHANLHMLDEQLHRCVWDRNFSLLEKVENNVEDHDDCKALSDRYFVRLTELPTNKITCGTVLSWLELDNRGRHIVSSDDSAINTPAVAAACAVRKYTSQAADEISFDVGEMISVIDMPPPEESVWWRGKRGFHVGFFPRENVQIIGDKLPIGLPIASSTRRLQRLSVSSNSSSAPAKPVLRKHGKLIAFFRSFILSRPSRRRLKQSGILRERVFSCDLAEHLLNTGSEIPAVLKCCSEFIEHFGIVDGIYRLSGITSNIQKLRNSFDEDKVPNLAEDEAIKQDIHAVSSLLKMYFRELPNPLCTYQLYEKFVIAAQSSDEQRLFKMREVVHELPPPHYRTLEYLMKHLARVAMKSSDTGMTPKNMAIVWAPNLIRCKELEAGGVAALKGIGVQAVVTEYLVRHADLIFNEKLPANFPSTTTLLTHKASGRPKSLAISSPIRLMSLEEAQDKAKDDRKYIEVGGGPSSLPPKYHTVIELPSRRSALKNKRSPIGWRTFFSRNRSFSNPKRKSPTPCEITIVTKNMSASVPHGSHSNWAGRLRPVKSVESLVSSPLYQQSVSSTSSSNANGSDIHHHHSLPDKTEGKLSKSSPATPVTDVHVVFHLPPEDSSLDPRGLLNPKTHNRSISHDSYFEFGEFRNGNNVYIDETLEEETMSQSSKLSLDISGVESNTTSLKTEMDSDCYGGDGGDVKRRRSRKGEHNNRQGCSPSGSFFLLSPKTPPPSAASVQTLSPPMMSESITSVTSVSSDECANIFELDERALSRSPLLKNQQRSRPSKWVESDDELLSPCYPSQNISENIESCNLLTNNTTSIKNNSNYKPDLTFEQPSDNNVEFRRSQISVYSSESKYELDRNSSVDESSADSTPGEVTFATTNIIYSPLVNEFPSPSSCGGSSKISRDSSATSSEEMGRQQAVQIQTCKLFICPLYEAGINVTDIPPDPDLDSPPTVIDTHIPNMHETFLSNNKVENNVKKSSFPPYENVKSPKASMEATIFVPTDEKIVSTATAAKITDGSNHLYENNHVYQNEVFATLRETTPDNNTANTAVIVESYMKADEVQQLLAKSQSNDSIIEKDEEKQDEQIYSEHYENIKENEDRSEEGDYEANIYEDIDEDENGGNSQDAYHDQNSYETVQVFGSGAADGRSNSSSSLSPPLPSTNCIPSQSNSTNAVATLCEDNSDAETEAAYESVQFHANTNHHHYAEIHDNVSAVVSNKTSGEESPSPPEKIGIITSIEKSTLNSPEDSSSQSHSHTEDVVTYLDTPAPCLKLREDSLEEPNQIKEDGEDGEFKLNSPVNHNSNSFMQSQTSPNGLSRRGSDEDREEEGGEEDNGEIRHIDSPVLVDNPLYGIQIDDNEELRQENNNVNEYNNENDKSANVDLSGGDAQSDNENDNDISMNESISISVGMDVSLSENGVVVVGGVDEGQGQGSDGKFTQPEEEIVVEKREKLLGRCNSAPLAETVSEFALAASSSQGICVTDHDLEGSCVGCSGGSGKSGSLALVSGGGSSTGDDESSAQLNRDRNRRREHYGTNKDTNTNIEIMEKLILCKRLSEPSLLFSNNTKAKSDDKCAAAAAAWKIADAKRLANRKQSVKELLSKFETNDRKSCSPVMISTSPVPGAVVVGHGLPRHDSSSSRQSIDVSSRSLGATNTTGGRFQHHRFSMGDILMTQSVSAAEDLSNIKSSAVMIRSDTFPELRTPEASKQMSQTSSINTHQSLSENLSDSGPVQVTEKVQQALRVAMSSVDMNDPSTRERIEKYKEERRMFLRQKITSDLSSGDTNVTKSSSDGSKGSQLSLKSPDFSVSSAESVFGSNCKLIAPEANSVVRSTESPRKRAFSEDIPPFYANQTKTIKTESLKSSKMMTSNVEMSVVEDETKSLNTTVGGGASPEEINVREKVALWSLQKTAPPGATSQTTGSFAENVQKTKEDHYSMIRVPKPILKEASSLPTEGFVRPTTVLRREVTTSSIEINKSQFKVSATNSKTESGKKIKDMAAFFERKQF